MKATLMTPEKLQLRFVAGRLMRARKMETLRRKLRGFEEYAGINARNQKLGASRYSEANHSIVWWDEIREIEKLCIFLRYDEGLKRLDYFLGRAKQ